ncbi:MAG: hypothetical protein IKM33_04005 [Clostridia bacterium]|nr:hypothetical protein [Clostridia bacterium]
MKSKNVIGNIFSTIFVCILLVIFLPFCLLWLIGYILYTPIDYIKFKRSAYQKSFPRKYKWLCGRHVDNRIYTIIKENNFPISYLRFYDDYELAGDFLYKDIALNFSQPFFFDEKKEEWLFWPRTDNENETEDPEDAEFEDNTDNCMTEEESREYILGQFKEQYPNVACTQMVFFYENKFVKSVYGDLALKKMQQNDSFILYQKGKLKEAIQEFISEADTKH